MLVPAGVKIFVYRDAIDMRKSFDGLCAVIQNKLQKDPLQSALYVFFNKPCDKIKIMYWDRNGHAIWYKRLSKGRFRPPKISNTSYQLSYSDLTCLLEGIDLLYRERLKAI